jgi:hypothetical protein
MKIYCASSWRNKIQPDVVRALRESKHDVYDFRHPEPENTGFSWEEIDLNWLKWDVAKFREVLANSEIAKRGFESDMKALTECDACVLVLPCGRSSHLELGYAVGAKKKTAILLSDASFEPELMYRMVDNICLDIPELLGVLDHGNESVRSV